MGVATYRLGMFTHAGAGMVKFIRCMQVQVLYMTGIIVSHGCRYGWYYPEVTFSLPSLAHSDVLKPKNYTHAQANPYKDV